MSSASSKRQHVTAFTSESSTLAAARESSDNVDTEVWTDPISVQDGVFEGKIVRFCLRCVQAPVSGKRKTEKDRRPLAPVPVIRFWVRECHRDPGGLWTEKDLDLTDLDPSCLICEVGIIPENDDLPEGPDLTDGEGMTSYDSPYAYGGTPFTFDPGPSSYGRLPHPSHISFAPNQTSWAPSRTPDARATVASSSTPHHSTRPPETARSRKIQRREQSDDDDEAAPEGRNLFGALHVAAVKVVAPTEELGLWFLFTDLSVQQEGIYSLQFKVFDLSVINPGMSPVPPFAECESQSFKVYAPRAFPGIPKVSELSEHFIRQGFKLNTRKNERTARSASPDSSTNTAQPSGSSGSVSRADPTKQHGPYQ